MPGDGARRPRPQLTPSPRRPANPEGAPPRSPAAFTVLALSPAATVSDDSTTRAAPRTLKAPAKVNLGLHVLRRRADGYHDLDTVFVPIPWHDTLAASPAPGLHLAVSGADDLPATDDNLVLRAARALAAHLASTGGAATPGALLHLTKAIPHGAGLGGGSSDAAAALRLLAGLWNVSVPAAEMHALARALGADVPFFLDPRPMRATQSA